MPIVTRNQQGVSLVELLLSIVMVVAAVVTLSLAFPQASKHIVSNRARFTAAQLASAEEERLRAQPYAFVDATPLPASNTSCDCAIDDFSVIPSTPIQIGAITYALQSCVNFMNAGAANTWTPGCAYTGYKNVRVRVSWPGATGSKSYTQAFMKAHN